VVWRPIPWEPLYDLCQCLIRTYCVVRVQEKGIIAIRARVGEGAMKK
jgi:hypothetical protein